jgi:DNA mismatch repair protein PMS2
VRCLFKQLPVRYKAFQRNVKKEYVKLVQVLQAYALVATGVKLLATNQARPPHSWEPRPGALTPV